MSDCIGCTTTPVSRVSSGLGFCLNVYLKGTAPRGVSWHSLHQPARLHLPVFGDDIMGVYCESGDVHRMVASPVHSMAAQTEKRCRTALGNIGDKV